MNDSMETIGAEMAAILQECERRGMVLPYIFVAASRNGSVLAIRVPGGGAEGEVLAEYYDDEMFLMPVTCMVVDQTDEAVRITITAEKTTFH